MTQIRSWIVVTAAQRTPRPRMLKGAWSTSTAVKSTSRPGQASVGMLLAAARTTVSEVLAQLDSGRRGARGSTQK